MSHHFDTPTGREDPRINLCDFYLFRGRPGTAVMVMTVNPDAGISAPESFREEGLYAFRFDIDGDGREEVTFKVKFGNVIHAAGDEHRHVQSLEVRRAVGDDALQGEGGNLIASGFTGDIISVGDISVYAGLAPELFAGDAAAIGRFLSAYRDGKRLDLGAWENGQNFFAKRNVSAIVLEVPCSLIGNGKVNVWATVSLIGHAPEVQVARWGVPLFTHIFLADSDVKEAYNRTHPSQDREMFAEFVRQMGEGLSALSGTPDPAAYGQQLVTRLIPTMLPYMLDTPSGWNFATINGRGFGEDVMDVILTLVANVAIRDGAAPDLSRLSSQFPYFGKPYDEKEQAGITPAAQPNT